MTKSPHRGPAWLESAIFYQIYPQSFLDTNNDGIGDIPGIIEKLAYIHSIGCDVVWLNPCFDSPFGDAGYDIRDFYKVAPRYGTNADLERLFAEAHRRGMKVVLDLVAGHTSIEHEWFQQSAKPERNEFTDRFVWTNTVWNSPGQGFEGVRGYSDRDGQYVTNFFHFQPALNYGFANPEQPWQLPVTHPSCRATQQALWDILQFWMDLGADGFRVDMAFSLVKNDPERKATIALWQTIRKKWERKYPEGALIAEWSIPKQAITAGFHLDFMIHFGTPAYTGLFRAEKERDAFHSTTKTAHSLFDRKGKGDIRAFLKVYLDQWEATQKQGYISIPSGNHDIARISCGRTMDELEVVFAFLLTQPGVPCIYYGDEIGMRHVENLASKEGGYGRTGARTPMQWTEEEEKAGFSESNPSQFYLPLDPQPDRPNVVSQENTEDSLLNLIRALCLLRRSSAALGPSGVFKVVYGKKKEYPFAFLRSAGAERFLILLNPAAKKGTMLLSKLGPASMWKKKAGRGVKISNRKGGLEIRMQGTSYAIYRAGS